MPTITEGTRVVCVVQVPGGRGGHGYWTPKVYEARKRKRDGALTWRCVEAPLGTFLFHGRPMMVGYRSEAKADRHGEEIADERGIRSVVGIRHGSAVRQ